MPDYKFLLYETLDSGRVVRIMLNRPDARNAQNRGLLVELNDAFLHAEADDDVRVVILGGTGPMFSSGHDLGSKAAREEGMPGPNQHPTRTINGAQRKGAEMLMLQEWHYFFENTRRWRNLRKITIGQAHGEVYAAGLMLLWACDLIVSAEGANFADVVGARLGMCGVEYFGHPWEFGPRKAKELLLTGDSIDADEAHRLGGSTEQVARYRLGKALAEAAPYLLLLSATPHQGKTASFQRLMALVDPDEFNTAGAIRREKVVPLVIRTEKRRAINERGDPLFLPRLTKLMPVHWEEKHGLQKQLYESVTEYVRLGYNQAIQQNRQYLGFLMILMQRLVTSSTQAITTAMERRLEALQTTDITPVEEEPPENNGEEQDSQEELDELLSIRLAGLANEKEEVRLLLDLARRCQAKGPDARAETLLDLLYENQRQENNPELKYLIFTEFVPTQTMLRDFLEQHGFSVVCLNGSMGLDQRRRVQREFAEKTRILVSTDAGGEGLNLQFAHVVINYDLPWNPMKIEQRIGRVDRIGQQLPVKAFNLIFEEGVELRVQEVLEEKLATILEEFGVDKTQDVLDSAENGAIFEKLYAQAILNPGDIEKNIEKLIQEVREQAKQEVAGRSYYGETVLDPTLAQQLSSHPLPFWVERMTMAYLRCEGGKVQRNLFGYSLEWPDGSRMEQVSFHSRDAQDRGLAHVSLEDDRIRRLVQQLPRVVVTEPIPVVRFGSLPAEVVGYWSLWRITLDHHSFRDVKIIPIFHHDDGRILLTTARHIWDRLLEDRPEVEQMGTKTGADVEAVFLRLRSEAERQGEDAFHELHARHRQRLKREQEKGRYAFHVRREAINRIGLPEVRQHRLKRLDEEKKAWAEEMRKREQVLPELQPVVLLRVEAGNG